MLIIKCLREQVYEYLRDEMSSGRINPNDNLDLNAISQKLNISKTPLRDALIKLEAEGFVTIISRRGVVVNKLSLEDVKSYYSIIGALEAEVVKEIIGLITVNEVNTLKSLNVKMRDDLKTNEFELYYQNNIAFHDVFLKKSYNNILRSMILPLKQRMYDFQRRPYVKEWEMRNCDEHDQFVSAIESNDAKKAVTIIRDVHWSFSVQEKYIRDFYSHNK